MNDQTVSDGCDTERDVASGRLHGVRSLTWYALPEGLSFDEWASEWPTLTAMAQASLWWLGDWLAYGEDRFGEEHAQAIEALTGLSPETIRNAVWVCRAIPPEDRRADVPFWHHQAVAASSIDRGRRLTLLAAAADEHLTRRELVARVHDLHDLDDGTDVGWRRRRIADLGHVLAAVEGIDAGRLARVANDETVALVGSVRRAVEAWCDRFTVAYAGSADDG